MANRIYLCLAHISEAGWEQKYIQEAFDTNWVVPLGPNVNGFEEDLKQYVRRLESGDRSQESGVGTKEVVALSSGTAAVLYLLCLHPSDQVSGCHTCHDRLRGGNLEYGSSAARTGHQRPYCLDRT